jgi:hypothetical protein
MQCDRTGVQHTATVEDANKDTVMLLVTNRLQRTVHSISQTVLSSLYAVIRYLLCNYNYCLMASAHVIE